MKHALLVAVALLGCGTRAATSRSTCGVGWSPLTTQRAPEASTGLAAKDATVIERVEIAGVDARLAETLRRELATKPGTTVVDAPLGDDLRRLWRLGVIDHAHVEVRGGVVQFVVEPRPAVRSVKSTGGDKLARARFRQLEATSFEPARVQRMTEALRESYMRQGRLDARVDAKQRTDAGGVDVCVAIDPGPRVTIGKIEFPGRKAVSRAKLLAAMPSTKVNRVGATFDEAALEYDQLYVSALYWDLGYANVKVGPHEIERRGNRIEISIPIEEGPVFRLGNVTTSEPVKVRLGVKKGEIFSRTKLAEARAAIAQSDKDIDVVTPLTRIDLEKNTIDVTFKIDWRFPWDALRSWLSLSP